MSSLGTHGLSQLAELPVSVAFKRNPIFQEAVQSGNVKALIVWPFHRADGVIVRFGVDRPHNRRLFAGNAYHAAIPQGALIAAGVGGGFNIRQQVVVVALKLLVISGGVSEIEYKLNRANCRDQRAGRKLRRAYQPENIAHRGRTEKYHCQIAPLAPAFESEPPSGVVEGVAEDVETNDLWVVRHVYFFVGGGAGGGVGCLGPTLVSTPPVLDGCLTPSPRCSILLSPDTVFLLLWWLHKGMDRCRCVHEHASASFYYQKILIGKTQAGPLPTRKGCVMARMQAAAERPDALIRKITALKEADHG